MAAQVFAADPSVTIDTPMAPPAWALLERQLLQANSKAADTLRGEVSRRARISAAHAAMGTLDGPDDAIETFYNWTLLHALGGSDSVLRTYKKALEGHYKQYGELRTKLTKLAENGAYYKEFVTQSDWFHTGEGMRGFMFLGLSDPNDLLYRERMKRFAGMYMGEDPEAPNYDPKNKVIKSIWTGSKGPMLHKATDMTGWAIRFPAASICCTISAGRQQAARSERVLPEDARPLRGLSRQRRRSSVESGFDESRRECVCADAAEPKYKDWVVEYVGAWKKRAEECGGNIPTNVGLDGKPGGEYNGQWWKGTYGWNFTIFDGELEETAHRNTFTAGAWPGFAQCADADGRSELCRRSAAANRQHLRAEESRERQDAAAADVRRSERLQGNGAPSWYHYTGNLFQDRLTEIYFWSMDRKDLERIPMRGFVGFLEGKNPDYPVKALQADLGFRARKRARDRRGHHDGGYAAGGLSDGLQSGRDTDADESHDGRISGRQYLDLAQPLPVLRSCATPRGFAGRCRRAGGEARSRRRHVWFW